MSAYGIPARTSWLQTRTRVSCFGNLTRPLAHAQAIMSQSFVVKIGYSLAFLDRRNTRFMSSNAAGTVVE
jgi:hypothetical protein